MVAGWPEVCDYNVKADGKGLTAKTTHAKESIMPMIGWLFLLGAIAMVVGSLLLLRDSANMNIPPEKLENIREQKEKLETEEKRKEQDW